MGRPWPKPGEPLFTRDDTDLAIALAEEEADTCRQCGLPIAVCSDPAYQFAFTGDQRMCWATYGLTQYKGEIDWDNKLEDTRRATNLFVRFRPGHEAPLDAGLDLPHDDAGDLGDVPGMHD